MIFDLRWACELFHKKASQNKDPVQVSSLANAPRHYGWAEQAISLLDPDIESDKIPSPQLLGVLPDDHAIFYFDDVAHPKKSRKTISPTRQQIREILQFAQKDKNILIHCHGGLCRSPAIAIGILILKGYEPRQAVRKILNQDTNNMMEPNEVILQYIDDELALGGELIPILQEELRK